MKLTPNQRQALELIAAGKFYPAFVREEDGWYARWLPDVPWLDEYVRSAAITPLTADAEDQHYDTLHDAWIAALKSRTGLVRWNDDECAAFAKTLSDWADIESVSARSGITFRLETEGERLFVCCDVPKGRAALKALGEAVYEWGKLRELRCSPSPIPRSPFPIPHSPASLRVEVTRNEAEDFARRGASALEAAGYRVERGTFVASITVAAEIRESNTPLSTSTSNLSLVVKVAGHRVSAEEIRFLLEQKSNFVYFHEHWIEIDRSILKEALAALEKAGRVKVNPLAFALGIGAIGKLEIEESKVPGAIGSMIAELRGYSSHSTVQPSTFNLLPPGFVGELRDYQRFGVRWLKAVTERGFGALLADDMGLGKTIQTIAWILSLRGGQKKTASSALNLQPQPSTFLIVAPLTLIANWGHEIARFAPHLKVYVHQGESRHFASGFRKACAEAEVVITSYNLLVRDHMLFAEVAWDGLVLDEAQLIKNFDTRTARAVCALRPRYRVALTGTPIENSVEDLWSLEEFLNPGLLGERKSFETRFVKPLAADPTCKAGRRLRRALEPFVLRRLKSDPGIAAELGGKRVIREYCALTDGQRADYERALGDYRMSVRKQGDVFALITALKLVCDGAGKLERLVELLGQIFAAGESALVFTQYAKVGAWLKRELDKRFGHDFPFLHGALSAKDREREINRFNTTGIHSQPSTLNPQPTTSNAFLLSLRAGGFGLNLVKATHVIHFDRWWNPAVEGQATDRAHRIGQERDVFVHEFITAGTLEEHIDDILARKQTLEGLLKDGEELWKAVELVR